MNRRGFLESLPFLPAAAKAMLAEPDPYRCVIVLNVKNFTLRSVEFSPLARMVKVSPTQWIISGSGFH